MELFTEDNQEQNESLFLNDQGVSPSVEMTKPSTVATPQINRTAMMAALGDSDMSMLDANPQNYLATLLETKQAYEDRISLLGDSGVRMEKAKQERLDEVRDAIAFTREAVEDNEREGAAVYARAAATQNLEEKSKTALEQRTLDTIQRVALRDPHAAAMFEDNLETPGTLDRVKEEATKRLIVQNYLDSLKADDRNKLHKAFDWTLDNLVVFWDKGLDITENVEVSGEKSSALSNFFLPGVRREAESYRMQGLSVEELTEFLPAVSSSMKESATAFGYTNVGELHQTASELLVDTPSILSTNAMQAIEIATVLPYTKIATTTSTIIRGGARKAAQDLTASAARHAQVEGVEKAAKKHGMEVEEVFDNLLPSALKNNGDDGLVGISTDAGEALREGRAGFDEFLEASARARLTSEEQAQLATSLSSQAEKAIPKDALKDVKLTWKQNVDGTQVPLNSPIVGKLKGSGGYASEKSLDKAMARYAVPYKSFQDESGEWFAEATLPIREEGFYTAPLDVNASVSLSKFLRGGGMQSDDMLQGSASQGGRFSDKVLRTFETVSFRNYGKLSKKDRSALDGILEAGRDSQEDWLSPSQLSAKWEAQTGSAVPPKVVDSYYDFKKIMDMTYLLRNQDIFKRKSLEGFESVSLPNDLFTGNARISRDMGDIPTNRLYDVSENLHYVKEAGTPMSKETWDKLKAKGYMKVSLERPVELPDGTFVKEFIGKKTDMEVRALDDIQVPYKAGIHRMYEDGFFVKAPTVLRQADTGTEVLSSPKAYRTFPSRKKALEWADTMNQARKSYLEAPDDLSRLARIFEGRPEYPSPEEFVQSVRQKKVDPDQTFEAVEDGQLPSAYSSNAGDVNFYPEATETSVEQLGRTQGRMYTSSRGERLKGFDGKEAPVLSPGQTLNRAAIDASRLAGYGDYVIESTTRMLKTFEDYIDVSASPLTVSPQARMKYAQLKKGTRPEIQAQWEAQKAIINRVLNQRNSFDEIVDNFNRATQDRLAEVGLPGVKVANWAQEANPLAALRGFAFHMKLGLFNPAQFILQASSSFQGALLSPDWMKINPAQAWAAGTVMRFAHSYGPKASKVLDNPGMLKALGFDNKESAKEMVEAFSMSGLLDVNNSHQLANSTTGGAIGAGRFGSDLEAAKKMSGTFFYEPEKINRAVAFTVAWREVQQSLDIPLLRTNGAAMKQVFDKTETYSFQMASESRSAFQKGPVSLPTQFFAYPIRMLELTFSGKKLTTNQKAKLLAGQLVMYGSAGFVGTEFVSDKIQENRGESFEKGTLEYSIDRGVIDTIMNMGIHSEDDTDINLSDRIGTGAFAIDLVKELINTSPYGETSAVDVAVGVGGQTVRDSYDAFNTLYKYARAVNGDFTHPLMKEAYLDVARDVSTVNNAYRGYMAFKHQQLYSKSGTLIDSDVTKPEAFALAIGVSNSTMNDTSVMMDYLKEDTETVKETARLVSQYRRNAVLNPESSDKSLAKIAAIRELVGDSLVWSKAISRVNRYDDTSSLETSIYQRYQKEKASKEFKERLEKRVQENKDNQ